MSNHGATRFAALAWVLIVSLLSLTPPSTTHAQVLYGSLTGNVTDPAGAAVPGAKVEALNVGTNVSKDTTTNDSGVYQFTDLLPGVYKVLSRPKVSKPCCRRGPILRQIRSGGST